MLFPGFLRLREKHNMKNLFRAAADTAADITFSVPVHLRQHTELKNILKKKAKAAELLSSTDAPEKKAAQAKLLWQKKVYSKLLMQQSPGIRMVPTR